MISLKKLAGRMIAVILILLYLSNALSAQPVGQLASRPSAVTQEDLDRFIVFFKYFVYIAGFLALAFAALGIMFFGFDVRNANRRISEDSSQLRKMIEDMKAFQDTTRDDIRRIQDQARESYNKTDDLTRSSLRSLEEIVATQKKAQEKYLAEQEEFFLEAQRRVEARLAEIQDQIEQAGARVQELSEMHTPGVPSSANRQGRTDDELIHEVIEDSKFEWTTIGRIESKTGLARDEIVRIARTMRDIEIGRGNKSKEPIFKLRVEA